MIRLVSQVFDDRVSLDGPSVIVDCYFRKGADLISGTQEEPSRWERNVFDGHVTIDGVPYEEWMEAHRLYWAWPGPEPK